MTARAALRVLVTDAVPMNGGDQLLLRALLGALVLRWPGCEITVMTGDLTVSQALLPDVRFVGNLRAAPDAARQAYASADLVISTPGGFLNRHYDFSGRLEGFRTATALGLPLGLFGQSIGPFADAAQYAAVGEALRGARLVAVRDAISRRHLEQCGVEGPQVVEVPDAAFLWPALPPRPEDVQRPARRVGLCLRRWPRDDAITFRETVRKTRRLMLALARRGIEEFVFASTCQGVDGYVDDAELSWRVVAGLTPDLAARTLVCDAHLSCEQYLDLMRTCDLFIGMRLHGCLMAMLAGTPALGLGYEDKTAQIFDQLGLGRWQFPFTRPVDLWCRKATSLVDLLPTLRAELPGRIAAQSARAAQSLACLDVLVAARQPGQL